MPTNRARAEQWKEMTEGPYLVSDSGKIVNSRTGKQLKPHLHAEGYFRVSVAPPRTAKRPSYFVHRLVAKYFVGPIQIGMTVNHKNGIKTDNRAENLEYMSRGDNSRHAVANRLSPFGEKHWASKLTDKEVLDILDPKNANKMHTEIANEYGLDPSTIGDIRNGVTWTHIKRAKAKELGISNE